MQFTSQSESDQAVHGVYRRYALQGWQGFPFPLLPEFQAIEGMECTFNRGLGHRATYDTNNGC